MDILVIGYYRHNCLFDLDMFLQVKRREISENSNIKMGDNISNMGFACSVKQSCKVMFVMHESLVSQ